MAVTMRSVLIILLLASTVKAQIDPASLVHIITTSFALVKYVSDMWKVIFNEKQDLNGSFGIPGPFPDLGSFLGDFGKGNDTDGLVHLIQQNADRSVLSHFAAISAKLNGMNQKLSNVELSVSRIAKQLPVAIRFEVGLDRLFSLIRPVHSLYDSFRVYQDERDRIEKLTLEDFALTVVSHSTDSVRSLLWQLHDSVMPGPFTLEWAVKGNSSRQEFRQSRGLRRKRFLLEGVFDQFRNYLEVYEGELCTLTKSPQQLVFDLYNLLALTDAKGYAMMQFSWMLLRLADKGNFSRESDLARIDFEKRVVEKAEVARRVISELPTWYDRCVSSNHTENETYHQFTEFLQGYVVNEVDLNTDNTCKEECKSYTVAQEQGCHKKTFCNAEKRCELGKLYSCTFFEADSSVCLSKDKNRRYDWIEYKSGRVVGQKSTCEKGKTARADSWWRFLYHCSNCICLCDQPGPRSDRYISLKPATANILAGNIVTGVKFVKQGRVVHIQIQEGKALARGAVNASSLQWRPVERIIPDESRTALINKYSDYAVLSWLERAIDLDHLVAPEGHVLTGLRFRRLGVHINLEIQVAPIQFSTGWIDFAGAIWMGSESTTASDKPRKIIPLTNADTPLRSPTRPMQDSGDNQYVEFQATSIDKDVGQTTIPFLDAQPVTPQPPMWLTGVGLVHKGSSGYGGFLSLKVATYDMTKHILAPSVVTPPKIEENPIQDNEYLN